MCTSKIILLLFHLLETQSFSFLFTLPVNKLSCVVHPLLVDVSSPGGEINSKNNDSVSIRIERVSSRSRVLDIRHYRGFSISASDFIHKHKSEFNATITEKDAISQLTSSYDDNGKELDFFGDPVVQFAAVAYHRIGSIFSFEEEYTNGVVIGAVDAKIWRCPSSSMNMGQLGIPWPHVSLKNLSVKKDFRRMGIASALVQAVEVFAREEKMRAVILEVDCANTGAVNLYEKEGFLFVDDEETIGGKMILALE